MALDEDWVGLRSEASRLGQAGIGALRIALLFGSAAIALALVLAPVLENQMDEYEMVRGNSSPSVDLMSTGTIGGKNSYTIRRSVLQSDPNSVCILRSNGTRSGDC